MIKELLKPEVQKFLKEHAQDNPAQLALKHKSIGDIPIRLIVNQLIARQKASKKFPGWNNINLIYPGPTAVEQASSEITASYKASLFTGTTFIDLTGGLGVDTMALSKSFRNAIYVEADEEKAAVATHNFKVLGLPNIEVINSTAEEFLKHYNKSVDLIYVDPDRRPNVERVQSLKESTPDIVHMQDKLLSIAQNVAIKASPMLDISAVIKELPSTQEVHVLAVNNECKELLFVLRRQPGNDVSVAACNFSLNQWNINWNKVYNVEKAALSLPKQYLYEPNAAILKANIQDSLAENLTIKKLHPSTQLFTSEKKVNFPGRIFKVSSVIPVNKKELLKELPDLKGNLSTRNFPEHVEKLKKRLGIKDGGNYYIFACRITDLTYKLIVTEKV